MVGERVGEDDTLHFPRYTKGCWGSPRHARCWLCKLRAPVKFINLVLRLRRHDHDD